MFLFFGWLSDRIGRKKIVVTGFLLAALTYFPIFRGITEAANPALARLMQEAPVVRTRASTKTISNSPCSPSAKLRKRSCCPLRQR